MAEGIVAGEAHTVLLERFFETLYRPLRLRSRSQNTLRLYRFSVRCFASHLGRPARLDDLTDECVSRHLEALVAEGLSPYTVNKERSQLLAIWNWAARKKYVDRFPDVEAEVVPRRVPVAWLAPELGRLVSACRSETGTLCGIPACDWWVALHMVAWDTAERIGALLHLKWDNLDSQGWLLIPAEIRKGKREDMHFLLGTDTMAELARIREPARELIFPWPYSETYVYRKYKKILRRAGLPTDCRSKFHRLRRTAASYYELAGGNATDLLGHANRETTKRYLDPRIVVRKQPSELLFRIGT